MSAETLIIVQGKGRILEVPEEMRDEGTVYGQSLSGAVSVLDSLAKDAGHGGFDYFIDADPIWNAIEDELGEPESDEEELQQERLFLDRAPYYAAAEALPVVRAILEHALANELEVSHRLRDADRASYRGTVWDLRVLALILEDAAKEGRGFFLWVL